MNFLWAFNISRAKDPSGREKAYDLDDFAWVSPGLPPRMFHTHMTRLRCDTVGFPNRAKPLRMRDHASLRRTRENDQT